MILWVSYRLRIKKKTNIGLHVHMFIECCNINCNMKIMSAKRIIGYYRMYEWKAKVRMILSACAGRSQSAPIAHVRMHFFV